MMFARLNLASFSLLMFWVTAQAAETTAKIEIPDAPDKAAETILRSMANDDVQVLWLMLPPKYQADIKELQKEIGQIKAPQAEVWKLHFSALAQVFRIASAKKEMVLKNDVLKGVFRFPEVDNSYDKFVQFGNGLLTSELKSFESISKIDPERFLATTGKTAIQQYCQLQNGNNPVPLLPEIPYLKDFDEIKNAKQAKVSVRTIDGDKATLVIEVPREAPLEMEWQKVEGRWIPADLAASWDAGIVEFRKKFIAEWSKEGTAEEKAETARINKKIKIALKQMDEIEKVKTQQEFDQAVIELMKEMSKED